MCVRGLVVVPLLSVTLSRMPLQLYDLPFDMLEMIGEFYDDLAQREAASALQAAPKRHLLTRCVYSVWCSPFLCLFPSHNLSFHTQKGRQYHGTLSQLHLGARAAAPPKQPDPSRGLALGLLAVSHII